MAEETPKVKEIIVDRDLCIGAATCIAVAPNVYELDDEAKAIIKDPKGNTDAEIIDSAKVCPVKAIILKDEEGKQIYP